MRGIIVRTTDEILFRKLVMLNHLGETRIVGRLNKRMMTTLSRAVSVKDVPGGMLLKRINGVRINAYLDGRRSK